MCSGEKLKILHSLCGKLLTLVSTRDFIEDNADEQRSAKQELRELKAEQHRREREEAAERYGIDQCFSKSGPGGNSIRTHLHFISRALIIFPTLIIAC